MQKYKAIAVVKIKNARKMSPRGRRLIAEWLRKKADDLLIEGENYSKSFRARYYHVKQRTD